MSETVKLTLEVQCIKGFGRDGGYKLTMGAVSAWGHTKGEARAKLEELIRSRVNAMPTVVAMDHGPAGMAVAMNDGMGSVVQYVKRDGDKSVRCVGHGAASDDESEARTVAQLAGHDWAFPTAAI